MKNQIKLHYTKKELRKIGWIEIGDSVKTLVGVFNRSGDFQDVHDMIVDIFSPNEVDDIYRGFLVYLQYGQTAYENVAYFTIATKIKR